MKGSEIEVWRGGVSGVGTLNPKPLNPKPYVRIGAFRAPQSRGPSGALTLGTCVGVAKGSRRVLTDAMGSST